MCKRGIIFKGYGNIFLEANGIARANFFLVCLLLTNRSLLDIKELALVVQCNEGNSFTWKKMN